MAYDILLRRQTPRNWACFSSMGIDQKSLVLTPDETQYLAELAVLRMKAKSGNSAAQWKWQTVMANHMVLRKRAATGDEKAQRFVAVLDDWQTKLER